MDAVAGINQRILHIQSQLARMDGGARTGGVLLTLPPSTSASSASSTSGGPGGGGPASSDATFAAALGQAVDGFAFPTPTVAAPPEYPAAVSAAAAALVPSGALSTGGRAAVAGPAAVAGVGGTGAVAAPAATGGSGSTGSTGPVGAPGYGKSLVDARGVPTALKVHGNGRVPASALAQIGGTHHRLWEPATRSFEALLSAARRDGISIGITDSYRTYESQVDLVKRKGLYSKGGLAATPGTSNHGWGTALDLRLDSRAQAWMRANGPDYGFVEDVPREPWHWHYVPTH